MRAMVLVCVMPADGLASGFDSCALESNNAINPAFGLCSIHAYNIGEVENPDPAGRELMQKVIGLKTTFITQQMYKNYEQMESMLNRFKTQLEKAVLRAKLQAAGAGKNNDDDYDDDDGYYRNPNSNIHLTGTTDCNESMKPDERVECYNKNYTTIANAFRLNNSSISIEVQRQLIYDYKIVCDDLYTEGKEPPNECKSDKTNDGKLVSDDYYKCTNTGVKGVGKKKNFQDCLDQHRSNINKFYRDLMIEKNKKDDD